LIPRLCGSQGNTKQRQAQQQWNHASILFHKPDPSKKALHPIAPVTENATSLQLPVIESEAHHPTHLI
jgi:hypothetical protein